MKKRYEIVVNEGNGVEINNNFNEFMWIKTEEQFKKWKAKTLAFSSGTYNQFNLLQTVINFTNIYELDNQNNNFNEYIKTLKKILNN